MIDVYDQNNTKTSTRFFNQSLVVLLITKLIFTFGLLSLNFKGGTYKYIMRPSGPFKKTQPQKPQSRAFNIVTLFAQIHFLLDTIRRIDRL
jgi:hypothetical protein